MHTLLRHALPQAFAFLSFIIAQSAFGHPADQSEMRVRPAPHQLEIRFTFNILTLTRFVGIDSDGDAKISMAELSAAQPRIGTYLNQHIHVEINRQKAMLGTGVRFEPLWPDAAQTPPMTEPEYAARNVDVTFVQTIEGKLLEDFWLGFEIFEQTGPMQTIRGVFEQDGRVEEVPFSVQEPEYLYDTGFADDPFLKDSQKQAAKPAAASVAAAAHAPEPVPKAAVGTSTAHATVIPPPALVAALEGASAAKTAASNDQRWWMIRVVVLMIILVVGRKLQLSASPRRRPRSK